MNRAINISAAGNTEVPAYLCLIEKGFTISAKQTPNNEPIWYATKKNVELAASGPLELLSLVALAEQRGHNWNASDTEIQDFMELFADYI